MPVVHVRGPAPPGDLDAAITSLAPRVADAVDESPDDVWCTFTELDRQTIGDRIATRDTGAIVYVDLLMRDRGDAAVAAALEAAATAVADAWAVPIEDVWTRFAPVDAGELFAGGGLLD